MRHASTEPACAVAKSLTRSRPSRAPRSRGLRALYERLGVPAVVAGFGSDFVTYSQQEP